MKKRGNFGGCDTAYTEMEQKPHSNEILCSSVDSLF